MTAAANIPPRIWGQYRGNRLSKVIVTVSSSLARSVTSQTSRTSLFSASVIHFLPLQSWCTKLFAMAIHEVVDVQPIDDGEVDGALHADHDWSIARHRSPSRYLELGGQVRSRTQMVSRLSQPELEEWSSIIIGHLCQCTHCDCKA